MGLVHDQISPQKRLEVTMQSDTASLQWRLVANFEEASYMRHIRNTVRSFMTHNQAEISYEQQEEWFSNTYLPALGIGETYGFLFAPAQEWLAVGYGLITRREGKVTLSGGLLEKARGKGYGRQLFQFLIDFASLMMQPDEIWLDVFSSNTAARKLYQSLGFEDVETQEGIVVMCLKVVS